MQTRNDSVTNGLSRVDIVIEKSEALSQISKNSKVVLHFAMDDDTLVNNYQEDVNESGGLSKNEVIKLLYNQDNSIALVAPEKFKSPIWERFRVVYFKGKFSAPCPDFV